MFAGGAETGIPHNQRIVESYDSLSFAPTILDFDGFSGGSIGVAGRVIQEAIAPSGPAHALANCGTTREVTANGGRLSCATDFRVVLFVLHKTMQTKRHPHFNEEHCKCSTIIARCASSRTKNAGVAA